MNVQVIGMNATDWQTFMDRFNKLYEVVLENKQASEPDKLLTVKEAAKMLRVTSKTVRDWIVLGKLKATDFNKGTDMRGNYKVSEKDIKEFIKRKRL